MNELQKINNKLGGLNLSDLFTYDPDTGIIRHNPDRPKDSFETEKGYKCWKSKCSGVVIPRNKRGYYSATVRVCGIRLGNLYGHRIALGISGVDIPHGFEVDHIDGNESNNRLSNLRVVTKQENSRNRATSKNNTSGTTGVHYAKSECKWRAAIMVDRKTISLGDYTNKDDAIKARKAAEVKYGFHENHGRAS